MKIDETAGEWRCRCPEGKEFDVSANPPYVSRCNACRTDRPKAVPTLTDEALAQIRRESEEWSKSFKEQTRDMEGYDPLAELRRERDAYRAALENLAASIQRCIDVNGDSYEPLDPEHVSILFGDLLFDVRSALKG